MAPLRKRQRRIEQAIVRLEESVELAGIADGRAGDRGLQPAMDLAAKAIAQYRLHATGAHALQSLMKTIETAEALELQLAKTDTLDGGGALDIGERADRLVQHQCHSGGSGHSGVGLPVIGIAGLLKQFDAGGIERRGEADAVRARIGPVGVEPQGRALAGRPLDRLHASEISVDVLANLDLEGAETLRQPCLDLALDLFGLGRVDRRQQRQLGIGADVEKRMTLEHFERTHDRSGGDLAGRKVCEQRRLGGRNLLAQHLTDAALEKIPTALPGLAARAWRDMTVREAGGAAIVGHLDQIRLELLERPIGQTIRPDQRLAQVSQYDLRNPCHGTLPSRVAPPLLTE